MIVLVLTCPPTFTANCKSKTHPGGSHVTALPLISEFNMDG